MSRGTSGEVYSKSSHSHTFVLALEGLYSLNGWGWGAAAGEFLAGPGETAEQAGVLREYRGQWLHSHTMS
jgi:hypothetical protein